MVALFLGSSFYAQDKAGVFKEKNAENVPMQTVLPEAKEEPKAEADVLGVSTEQIPEEPAVEGVVHQEQKVRSDTLCSTNTLPRGFELNASPDCP